VSQLRHVKPVSCHVEENWFVRNCPFVNTLRRHHTAHHNPRLMIEVNMNLTFPIADWLFELTARPKKSS